ncbi:MAG: hypothetical protein NWQ31_04495 [Polaribacter sp.]|nr:hypothetical protein [Polaribacter sp.]
MEHTSENNGKKNFLEGGLKGAISKHHKKYLGTEIPENYFATSKLSILDKIKSEEIKVAVPPKKQLVFWMKPSFKYMAAASIILLFGLTIWMQNLETPATIHKITIDEVAYSNDVLLESLLIEESELETFTNATLFQEVVVKAELSEQKLENLILNTLIVEDSLLDDYIDDKFIETIIL